MLATPFHNDRRRLCIAHGLFVGTACQQRVVHIGHRHQAGRQRNRVTHQAFGVARAIPLFMVAARNLHRVGQKRILVAHVGTRALEDVEPALGMGLHDAEFFRGVLAGLQQNVVGNRNLANVVQRRGLADLLNDAGGQLRRVVRQLGQLGGQHADVLLGAPNVVARGFVTKLGQRHHHKNGRVLQAIDV